MNILIIGGTRFLGRHLADAILARGHTLTLFNRGKTNPGLFPQVETILGDRELDLGLLSGRTWDAVIDTCGYFPRIVGLSAQALRDTIGLYVFISSISVYADTSKIGIDENDASWHSRGYEPGADHRRELRPAQSALRTNRSGRSSRPGADHPPGFDRRPL